MIKVNNDITVYEIKEDADEVTRDCCFDDIKISIKSHWNCNERVVICIGDQEYTVVGRDLESAIENAMNVNRY